MKKQIYILLIFLLSAQAYSQTVLMMNNVHEDLAVQQKGENLSSFDMLILRYGHHIDVPGSIGVNSGKSFLFGYGMLHKVKVNKVASVLIESGLTVNNYRIKQDSVRFFKDTLTYDKERITLFSWDFALGLRFNFDRHRGNHLGWYMDISAFGGWNFLRRRNTIVYDQLDDVNVRYKMTERKPPYTRRFTYGAEVRFGYAYISFFGRYRLADMFKPVNNQVYPELTRWTAGIVLTLPNP